MTEVPEQRTTAISAPCSRRFRAVHTSGRRDPRRIRWIVLHDEEAKTAVAAAAWFTNPESQGSAHLCVDDVICFRTLDNADIAWGTPGANEDGFHIEQAGFARWSAVIWKQQGRRFSAPPTRLRCTATRSASRRASSPHLR